MQTFLPHASFSRSARVLDWRRLGKQRVEAWQILNVLNNPNANGWRNHPAVQMWRGYEIALAEYGRVITVEWIGRGYNDSMLERFERLLEEHDTITLPPWWRNRKFHNSHKSNLLRKDEQHYRKFWPNVPNDLPYVWPTKDLAVNGFNR